MRLFSTIVLAGGASSRMGAPKALLPFGRETLVERVAGRMAGVSAEVIVVGGPHVELPSLPAGTRVVRDEPPLQGPLSGIAHGLRAATTDLCFVCGCDHPFLAPALARLLVERADQDGAVSVWGGREQPLLAVYRRGVGDVAAGLVAAGERRALSLLEHARLVRVAESDLVRADPSERSFFDVDTPEAYARALRLLDRGHDAGAPSGVRPLVATGASRDPAGRLRLFVYGTLATGGRYHRRFCAGAISVERASVPGRIRRLPEGYPMLIVPSNLILAGGTADAAADADTQARIERSLSGDRGIRDGESVAEWTAIAGEVLTFDDDPARRLPPIDEFEGFHPDATSLYRRVLLAVHRERASRPLAAWAYVEPSPA